MKPWLVESWCTPKKKDPNYVAAMEDLLDLYHLPRDPGRPLVCLDEVPVQLLGAVAPPLPPRPGGSAKEDYEYVRNGSGSVFMAFAPLEGRRTTYISPDATRTAKDYAQFLRIISEEFPEAEGITLIQDNLSTHKPGSLYKAFPAPEARGLAKRFDFHYTPVHGSWLNVAESEISVLSRQCLARRIPDVRTLRSEVAAWETQRNKTAAKANWQFTTDDARIKLHSQYPSFD